jgi:serine/threonine protein kinase
MNLQPGLHISDSVELRSPIGQGGMGQVWAGLHGPLRRDVAVKFLCGEMAEDASAVERFTVEAQTLALLQSRHVPQVFDFGTMSNGVPFIVMELLEGVDLERQLELDGRLSLEHVATLTAQMGSVLSLAHGLGVVHRDIKPGNIILIPCSHGDFIAKLLDFGIVKTPHVGEAGAHTGTGTTFGTPAYMSPEQLLSARAVDARADLWSLAVVAYRCLTGELPFEGETFAAVCIAIDRGDFAPPSTFRPGLPIALDAWFRKALSRNPKNRFASAGEMVEAFDAAIAESLELPLTPPSDPAPRGPASHRRSRAPSGNRRGVVTARTLGAASLVAVGGAAVLAAHGSFGPDWRFDWNGAERQGVVWVDSCAQRVVSLIR